MVERLTQRMADDPDRNPRTARLVNLLAGVWLFVSAFLWAHSMAQRTNAWIVGLVIAGTAALAMRAPQLRFVNTIAAVWLFLSAFVLPTLSSATVWNHILVALVVFAASMVGHAPGKPMRPARV